MSNIFWIITAFTIAFLIYEIITKKDYFSLNTYILLGIYLPLIMSTFNWSFLHVENKPNIFYILFFVFDIFAIIINILPQRSIKFANIKFEKKESKISIEVYNAIYIICVLIENYYASGYLFPSFHAIDVHTARMPIIYLITTAIYIVSVMNLMEFFVTKKKRYLAYIAILVAFNVITKSARIDAFICAIQLISIGVLYVLSSQELLKKNKVKIFRTIGIVGILVVTLGVVVGQNRMNSNGKYDIKYSDGIKYTGPSLFGEIISYYYGYFPLSFDNLAYNMQYTEVKPNYLGLSTFRALYFGVLQADNIFGLDGGEATKANQIRSKAAAVATGFWDFYYDYKEFFFIPLMISFALYYALKRSATKKNPTVLSFAIYFYWIPLWFFLSFDNRIYDYQVLVHIIIMYIIIPRRYKLNAETEK